MITPGWSLPVGSGGRRVGVFLAHTCRSDADTRGLLGNRTEDKMEVWEPGSWSRWCAGSDLHTHASPAIQTCSREQDAHQRHWTDESRLLAEVTWLSIFHWGLPCRTPMCTQVCKRRLWGPPALFGMTNPKSTKRPNKWIHCEIMFCRSKKKQTIKLMESRYNTDAVLLVDFITV